MDEPAAAFLVSGSTLPGAEEHPPGPAGHIVLDGYFVSTTLRGPIGGVVAPLTPIYMTAVKALREWETLERSYPRAGILQVFLSFDPEDASQMHECVEYLEQRERELGEAQ